MSKSFSQKTSFTLIYPYYNFSKISWKPKNLGLNTFVIDNEDDYDSNEIFTNNKDVKSLSNTPSVSRTLILPEKNKENKGKRYFYSGLDCGENIKITPYDVNGFTAFITNKDHQIKNHYPQPFSSIFIKIFERKIIYNEDKVTIEISEFRKTRLVNSIYFTKKTRYRGITIDKYGNIITYMKNSAGAKKIRKNDFPDLRIALNEMLSFQDQIINLDLENIRLDPNKIEFFKQRIHRDLNKNDFEYEISNIFKQNINNKFIPKSIDEYSLNNVDTYVNMFLKDFVLRNKIKVHDYYEPLLFKYYPTKKYLKKNDNKLISAILEKYHIKNNITNRILNIYPHFDLDVFLWLVSFLGYENFNFYLSKINPLFFKMTNESIIKIKNKSLDNIGYLNNINYNNHVTYDLNFKVYVRNNIDKERYIQILNEICNVYKFKYDNTPEGDFLDIFNKFNKYFNDHISMIEQIQNFGLNYKMRSNTINKLKDEHKHLSLINNMITNLTNIKLIYNSDVIKEIEEPIKVMDDIFYPKVLTDNYEYVEEGAHMGHCVSNYIKTSNSIIISLRHLSDFSDERVTCEYNPKTRNCVQARYKHNQNPPDYFIIALKILDQRIKTIENDITYCEKIIINVEKEKILELLNKKNIIKKQFSNINDYSQLVF